MSVENAERLRNQLVDSINKSTEKLDPEALDWLLNARGHQIIDGNSGPKLQIADKAYDQHFLIMSFTNRGINVSFTDDWNRPPYVYTGNSRFEICKVLKDNENRVNGIGFFKKDLSVLKITDRGTFEFSEDGALTWLRNTDRQGFNS